MKFQVIEWTSFLGALKCHPTGGLLGVRRLPPQEPVSRPGPAPGSLHLRVTALLLAHWKGETQLFSTSISLAFTMGPSTFSAPSKFEYFQSSKRQIVQLTNISWAAQPLPLLYHFPSFPGIVYFLFCSSGTLYISTEYFMLSFFIFLVTC